jgi:hypothetical protein
MPLHHPSATLLPSHPPPPYATARCPRDIPVMWHPSKQRCGWWLGAWTRRTHEAKATARGATALVPATEDLDRWRTVGAGSTCEWQSFFWGGHTVLIMTVSAVSFTCLSKYQYQLVAWIGPDVVYNCCHCRNHVCFHDDIISKVPIEVMIKNN